MEKVKISVNIDDGKTHGAYIFIDKEREDFKELTKTAIEMLGTYLINTYK